MKMEKVSLLIKNAQVFNTYLKKFVPADVSVLQGKFYYIDREKSQDFQAEEVLDARGMYMIPGFIDIHMHIESSMMTPGPFGNFLAGCGVTTIVSEPHEIANVKGMRGILEMIAAAEDTPIDIYYGIPSSVPSTSRELETTGGVIDFQAMKHLLEEKDVVCVGEIMNYRQIIKENELEITRFLDYLRTEKPGYVIEGHCPSLTGLDLAKFLYLGINGDHTEHTLEEVRQRIENGMFFELQEKMLREEIIAYIRENNLFEYVSFVTDDTMADTLYETGHLNAVAENAVKKGFPLEQAIYCATYTPSRRMHLYDRGAIAPGLVADFQLLRDPAHFQPEYVFKNGALIFSGSKGSVSRTAHRFPEDFYNSVILPPLSEKNFEIPAPVGATSVMVRAMEVSGDRTQTREKLMPMAVKNGKLDWQGSGCLLAMAIERHGKNGNIGYGFVTGNCMKHGTVATTYCHDHHNLLVAGDSPEDMLLAVCRLQELQGGFLTVDKGKILAELALPVAGLLSEKSLKETAQSLKAVRQSMENLGYAHYNPIMSFATLGLPVSPALKLTDKGLIDVKRGRIVPLILS